MNFHVDREWEKAKGYVFHIAISKDEYGRYSVIALNLPGAGSSGDTPEEAMANFKLAAHGVVRYYREAGEPIPWKETTIEDVPVGVQGKRIVLDV